MLTCKLCGESKGEESFYANSRVRCKDCVHRLSRERYHRVYRERLRSQRRKRDAERKARKVLLSDVERAYAAGLVDGEGSIRMTWRGLKGGKTFREGQITLMVELTNTDQRMVRWMQDAFGGSVTYSPESVEKNRRARWHWRVAANTALYCLDAIWPYVRTKRAQAKIGRRFQRYIQYPGVAITDKRRKLQVKCYMELKELNRRGVVHAEPQVLLI